MKYESVNMGNLEVFRRCVQEIKYLSYFIIEYIYVKGIYSKLLSNLLDGFQWSFVFREDGVVGIKFIF